MIIVLEGENKTGKTTLATYLVQKHGFEYIKCSQPKGDPYVEYMKILKKIERKPGKKYVIDRFLYGERVYGPIYRGKSMIDDNKQRNIELKLMSLNTLLIYCHDTVKEIAARFDKEGEEFAVKSKIKEALRLYKETIEKTVLHVRFHQMKTAHDLLGNDDKISQAVAWLSLTERPAWKTVIGNTFDPKIVLVGETRNGRQQYGEVGQPFDFGPAGEFLFNKLDEAGIHLNKVAIMNSDSRGLLKFVAAHDAIYVALGKRAHKKLLKEGINHVTLAHPQYESRFKRHTTTYAQQLKAIKML